MRILVHNYSNSLSTQAMYFNECLKRVNSVESHLWNSTDRISTYDMFDRFKPDLFVVSYTTITRDIAKYINSNDVPTVCDITGATQEIVDTLDANFNFKFYISETYEFLNDVESKKTKIHNIYPSFDVFSVTRSLPNFKLPVALICAKQNEVLEKLCSEYQSYHKINILGEEEGFDLVEKVATLSGLYSRYNKVVICDDVNISCSQVFFDALMRSENVYATVPTNQKTLFHKFLSTIFTESDADDPVEGMKKQVQEQHTCFHRTLRLLDLLENKEGYEELKGVLS